MGWLLSLLSGPFVSAVSAYLTTRANADMARYKAAVGGDVALAQAQIAAQIELNKQAAALAMADKGWWVTAWMKPFLFYPCATYFNLILIDSAFHMNWDIGMIPRHWDPILQTVLLATIGMVGLTNVARVFTRGSK